MLLAIVVPSTVALTKRGDDVAFGVTIEPSSVMIKVGDKSEIKVAVTNPEQVSGGKVCFSLDGFPASGFRTTFTPECADSQRGNIGAVLTVEATPAAAPQNVTAYVIASSGNQTAQTVLNVTVVPAMPAWIPWAGLLLFFSILGIAIFLKPRMPRKGDRRIASGKENRASHANSQLVHRSMIDNSQSN